MDVDHDEGFTMNLGQCRGGAQGPTAKAGEGEDQKGAHGTG
jgi:hypothetical protein